MKKTTIDLTKEQAELLLPLLRKFPVTALLGRVNRRFGENYHIEIIPLHPGMANVFQAIVESEKSDDD